MTSVNRAKAAKGCRTTAKQKAKTKTDPPVSDYFLRTKDDISFAVTPSENTMKIKMIGTPRPMYRTQAFGTVQGKPKFFTPSAGNKNSITKVIKSCLDSHDSSFFNPKLEAPVSISVNFYFKRPKKHYKLVAGNRLVLSQDAPKYVTKTPDIDNLVKLVLDAVKGVVYPDDSVVASLSSKKLWLYDKAGTVYNPKASEEECIILKITQHKHDKLHA